MHIQVSVRTERNTLSSSTCKSASTHCNLSQNLMNAFRHKQVFLARNHRNHHVGKSSSFPRNMRAKRVQKTTLKSKCKEQSSKTLHTTNLLKLKYGYIKSKAVQVCNYLCNLEPRTTQFCQKIYELTGKTSCQQIVFLFHFSLIGHPSATFWQGTTFPTPRSV